MRKMAKAILLILFLDFVAFGFFLIYNRSVARQNSNISNPHLYDLNNNCAQVCFSIVSKILGKPINLKEAGLLVPVNNLRKTSMSELIRAFRSRQFAAVGAKLTPQDLKSICSPIILFVNDDHFIVSNYTQTTGLSLFDPPRPVVSGHDTKFNYKWDGESIIICSDQVSLNAILDELRIPH